MKFSKNVLPCEGLGLNVTIPVQPLKMATKFKALHIYIVQTAIHDVTDPTAGQFKVPRILKSNSGLLQRASYFHWPSFVSVLITLYTPC